MSDKAAATVAKNSIWLIAQPLALSIISLFVVGFVARTLGPNDYGIFVFAFAFTTLFKPVINMGLRALTVRTIAEQKIGSDEYLGQMLVLRFLLGMFAIGLVFAGLIVFNYSDITVAITLIASTTLLLQSLTSVFHDAFQAHETMRHVAVSQFVSGIMTSALTILVMLLGYGLYELVAVYVLGNLVTLLMSVYYQWKYFKLPPLNVDLGVFFQSLKKGFPFFVPMILNVINGRFGLLLLSKFGTNSTVATYGAATNLTDKLLVVPEGLGASIFPTMAALAQDSKEQAVELYQRYSRYIFLLGLPMAVGTTALSNEIVDLIYGPEYRDTALVLAILIWGTFFGFLNSMNGWTLNAMHREKIGALIPVFTTPIFLVLCFSLAKSYGVIGVAVAISANAFLTLILLFILIRIYVTKRVYPRFFLIRAILAIGLMYFAIKYALTAGVIAAFVAAVLVYVISLPLLQLVDKGEIAMLRNMVRSRLGSLKE